MKKFPLTKRCVRFHCSVVSIFLTTAAFATALPDASSTNDWEHATTEALADTISQTATQIKTHARKASEQKEKIDFAWNNPAFTSAAIVAKRQALKEAEAAFIEARIALQEEIYRLPEIQQLAEDHKALLNEIETLQNKNTTLIKRLKMLRISTPSNDEP